MKSSSRNLLSILAVLLITPNCSALPKNEAIDGNVTAVITTKIPHVTPINSSKEISVNLSQSYSNADVMLTPVGITLEGTTLNQPSINEITSTASTVKLSNTTTLSLQLSEEQITTSTVKPSDVSTTSSDVLTTLSGSMTKSSSTLALTQSSLSPEILITSTVEASSDSTTTTSIPPTPIPCRRFDVPSFIGGIVLTIGILAISLVAYKFYKARNDRNYHTL